jgi:hypothetical protein
VKRAFRIGVLLLGFAIVSSGPLHGDDKVAPARTISVPVDEAVWLQSTSKKPVQKVMNSDDKLARIIPAPDDPSQVLIFGIALGTTQLTLTDNQGTVERVEIVVRRFAKVPVGGTLELKATTQERIRRFTNGNDTVAKVTALETGTVQVEGLKVGSSQLDLTDNNGKSERVEVEVRKVDFTLPVGQTKQLQMSGKGDIKFAGNSASKVGEVSSMLNPPDPAIVVFRAVSPGVTTITLIDPKDTKEVIVIGVIPRKP